ncbi:MFS transporter [Gallibacterium salpingitidis]|uniref:Major facilitator superfamily (MFS) profile domain-containing protein n=1 Tax=Gallibacterium salpingitidis TaxID=505341 RepID=A0A1A7NMP9_9PAST|nr:MFS transporter [Gallibacterium salpingitidis]OBW90806.1 hypothetical protein QS62_11595 [Gallibacterium salpingitidis]
MLSKQQQKSLLIVLAFSLIISVMNGTMFNIVLPNIREEFALSSVLMGWFSSSFLIVYAISTAIYGKCTERFSLKTLLIFAFIVLLIADILGYLGQNYASMLLARVLQATGTAIIPTLGMIIPARYFAVEERGFAFGMTATGAALGAAIGPMIAGFVAQYFSWRALFLLSLILVLTLPLYVKNLPNEQGKKVAIDFVGGIFLACGASSILLAITQFNVIFLLFSLVAWVLFVIRIHHTKTPFIHPSLFKNTKFIIMLCFLFIFIFVGAGESFLAPLYLSEVYQLSAGKIGTLIFPAAIITAAMGVVGGKIVDKMGALFLLSLASLMLLLYFVGTALILGYSEIWIAVLLVFGVLGCSYLTMSLSNFVSYLLPEQQIGIGMGLFSLVNFMAYAFSSVVCSKLLDLHFNVVAINLLPTGTNAVVYSNILLFLALIYVVGMIVFKLKFSHQVRLRKV